MILCVDNDAAAGLSVILKTGKGASNFRPDGFGYVGKLGEETVKELNFFIQLLNSPFQTLLIS